MHNRPNRAALFPVRPDQSRQLLGDRQSPDAFARGGKQRVGERGGGRGQAGFAKAADRGVAFDEEHVDRGGGGEFEHGVVGEA